ncbi:MAG: 3-deoxy-manno-octulosonate cytidylyltransferase [Planctomycetaceae bacterium]|nr:3-deoxy-manno-octulosonate cytidylyltransferase [Planctomycetaceae bacterium]
MKVIVVIPARYGSSRMAGKVLAKGTGKYLVQHTYERALTARGVHQVLIATDDSRVLEACKEFGAPCVMTSAAHQSGTDRIAEAAAELDVDIIVNLQADEPEIDAACIELVAGLLIQHPEADMGTLLAPFERPEDVLNPNIVKCVTAQNGKALYFSRSVIPCDRTSGGAGPVGSYKRHLGIYAYRKDFLMKFSSLKPSPLELEEKLEQLRALENGYAIWTAMVKKAWDGVDTEEQYKAFVKRCLK